MKALVAALTALLALPACAPEGDSGARNEVGIGLPRGPSRLEPNTENELFAISSLTNAYEGLVERDGSLGFAPLLVERWETPDDLTWRLFLRDGVRFHDGSELDAAFAAERLRWAFLPDGGPTPILSDVSLPLASLEAVGPRELLIRTREPVDTLQPLARLLLARERHSGGYVGTGPFRVASYVPGERMVLERFEEYWGPLPKLSRIRLEFIPDGAARMQALASGKADLIFDPPLEAIREGATPPGTRIDSRPGARVILLGTNPHAPLGNSPAPSPLGDARVREALALAVDRNRLVEVALGGHGESIEQLVPASVFGHHPDLEGRSHDPERAHELLTAAGFGEGFAVPLHFPSDKYRSIETVVELLVQDLAAIGVRAEPRGDDYARFELQLQSGELPLFLVGWLSVWDAGVSYRSLVHSAAREGGFNGFGYASPEVDVALDQDRLTVAPSARRGLLNRVTEILREELPFVPLYRQDDLYAIREGLVFEPTLGHRIPGATLAWSEGG